MQTAGANAAALICQEYSRRDICLWISRILRGQADAPNATTLLSSLTHSDAGALLVKAVKLGPELASLLDLDLNKLSGAALWEKIKQRKQSLRYTDAFDGASGGGAKAVGGRANAQGAERQ